MKEGAARGGGRKHTPNRRRSLWAHLYTGESKVGKKWQDYALERTNEMGLISDVEGAKLVDLEKWKFGKAVLRKKDGTSIYLTRDIGGAIERYQQHKFDKMIYVISSQQDLHTAQFIKMLHLMEFPWVSSIEHVNYGLVLGMSTRKGAVVFLEQIIRGAASVMHEQMKKNQEKDAAVEDPEQTSLEVGLTAIKIQDMAAKRINNYNFNWDRMTSFEGDTVPYLQYAHVRLTSLTRKSPELLPLPRPEKIAAETLAEQPAAREIVFLLGTYPDVVRTALRTHEPSGGWSRSGFGSRMRSRVRGRRSWSRARRMSSVHGLGCGFICVRGTCLGLRCGC